VRHHLIDEILPGADISAGEFGNRGRTIIGDIFRRGRLPLVVGGSGLYIRSLVDGLFEGPGADQEYRRMLEGRLAAGRGDELLEELRRVDPSTAAHIDPTKPRRIIRALEVFHLTGRPLSEYHREHPASITFTPLFLGLEWDRTILYDRINRRCEEMIAKGLLAEVEQLERRGYNESMNALNTVGYREAYAHRRGDISYEEMLRLFKQNSRRYAKRQMTWFKADSRIHWIPMNESAGAVDIAIPKVYAILSRAFPPR
jgi:tRNA dimethylallyltransferase